MEILRVQNKSSYYANVVLIIPMILWRNGTETTTSSDIKSAKDKLQMPCGQIQEIQPKSL